MNAADSALYAAPRLPHEGPGAGHAARDGRQEALPREAVRRRSISSRPAKRPVLAGPDAPCVTCINETLRQRYSEEHAAHEAYEALAENAGTHRCMLLKIAEEECSHAQMILCILQTCL